MALELADLRVFVTAASVGSLSAAARELRLTQPSISERLSRLERLVGRPLLHRSNRGVSLTPAGQRLLPHAERCLELASRALDIAREDDTRGTMHLTTHASYAPLAVPFVIGCCTTGSSTKRSAAPARPWRGSSAEPTGLRSAEATMCASAARHSGRGNVPELPRLLRRATTASRTRRTAGGMSHRPRSGTGGRSRRSAL